MTKTKQNLLLSLLDNGFTVRANKEAITIVVPNNKEHDLTLLQTVLDTCKVKLDVSKELPDANIFIFIK